MKYSRMFMFIVLMAAAAASFGAYNAAKPADNEYVADVPALVRENFRAIKDDAIVNAGTISGYSVGSASGNIPRNDGSLNTNLNVDKLDNYHGSDYVATTTVQTIKNKTIDSTNSVADAAVASTIARDSELSAVSSACNASDALNLRLDGSRAMTGNLKFSGDNLGILANTVSGMDNFYVALSGSGSFNRERGAIIYACGNQYPTQQGQLIYRAGNVSTGHHVWSTGSVAERMRLTYGGNLLIGTTTDDGTNKLQVNGGAKITGTIESTGAATVGGDLTVTGASTNFRNAIKAVDGSGSGLEADKIPLTAPSTPANGQIWLQ